ncbi:MAG TPA: hypothetical protein VFM36_12985 [Thermoanaerobaculia bacterium]|nr:hypothetical protein [Thermoanaerobaculia bacterium]
MMARKKVVPAVERRTHRRIVTLRNFGIATVVILLIVAVLNIRSEMRDTTGDEDFGRLYGREMKKAPPVTPAPITERPVVAPVDESASADPFSLESAAREQYLGTPTLTPEPVTTATMTTTIAPTGSEADVRIVGGPEGVGLIQEERKKPQLGGGFGRP